MKPKWQMLLVSHICKKQCGQRQWGGINVLSCGRWEQRHDGGRTSVTNVCYTQPETA